MKYRLVNNKPEQYSVRQYRVDTGIAISKKITAQQLADDHGIYDAPEPSPVYDSETQVAEGRDFQLVDGEWQYVHQIRDMTELELAPRVRSKRDRLLESTDWTQVADAPVDQAAWAMYRQALRDIPDQAGFPFNITWPQQP